MADVIDTQPKKIKSYTVTFDFIEPTKKIVEQDIQTFVDINKEKFSSRCADVTVQSIKEEKLCTSK